MLVFFRILVPLIILALAGAGTYWLIVTKPQAAPQAAEEKVWTLTAQTIERIAITPNVEIYGEIVAGSSVTLRPLVPGRVDAIGAALVDGAVIRKGDLLVSIDPFDYEAALKEAEADLEERRAKLIETEADLRGERQQIGNEENQVALRDRDFKRRADLRARGTGNQKAVDDAELALNDAKEQLIQRRQMVQRLQAQVRQQTAQIQRAEVGVERANRDLAETDLVAPYDGFILETDAAVGRIMSTNDPVARIIDSETLEARFQLTDSDYARLLGSGEGVLGRPAKILWRIGEQALPFEAHITRIGAQIDAAAGGIFVYARLDDVQPDILLRPGAFVQVVIPDRDYSDVIRLPANALEGGKAVYQIDGDGRLARIPVTIVRRLGGEVLVRPDQSEDLPEGSQVVINRFPEIGPGIKVEIR